MSLGGRLASDGSSSGPYSLAGDASTCSLIGVVASTSEIASAPASSSTLWHQLAACEAALRSRDAQLRRLRAQRDEQLTSLCRQLLSLECGLRRKEREMAAALRQRDRKIAHQTAIIKFLAAKSSAATAAKERNISRITDEAMAKIPQVVFEEVAEDDDAEAEADEENKRLTTTIRVGGGEECSSHGSSNNEDDNDDSDSAIIVDSSPSSTSVRLTTRVSRSVSDVVVDDEDEDISDDDASGCGDAFQSAQYRGFLLRHGSYERFKRAGSSDGNSPASVTVNPAEDEDKAAVPSVVSHMKQHRGVVKPRDVKNRSTTRRATATAMMAVAAVSADGEKMSSTSSAVVRQLVEKQGSVYRSVLLDDENSFL